MQYVGQTCRTLQKRVGEHYCRIRKPKNNNTFLYQHFKRTGHSPNAVIVQPDEKISYDENSSVRFKNIKRLETELKWIKLLQTPFPLGFNDNIYHEGNISKMPDFDVLTLSESRKRKEVQVGKDQEKAQSEKDSHSKNRGGKKPNQQSGTYTMKHIVSRMSSYFPNRWPLSYLYLTKNMKTYIRRQQHKKKFSNTKT